MLKKGNKALLNNERNKTPTIKGGITIGISKTVSKIPCITPLKRDR